MSRHRGQIEGIQSLEEGIKKLDRNRFQDDPVLSEIVHRLVEPFQAERICFVNPHRGAPRGCPDGLGRDPVSRNKVGKAG